MERSATDPGTTTELAWRDDLTGAWNRRYLRRLLTEQWAELVAAQGTMTLLVLDLDGFKPINDTYGHLAGDRVLRWAADELRRGFREEDRLIRYGGDEFIVALSDVGVAEARSLAERARSGFGSVRFDDPQTGRAVELPISFSIGVASFPEDGQSGDEILALADQRLYEEKRRRRRPAAGPASGRRRWVLVSVAALGAALLTAGLAIRQARQAPPVPAPDFSGAEGPATNPEGARPESPDEAALQLLRDEVSRLREALAVERVSDERALFETRIRELEARLANAASIADPRAEPPPSESEPSSGLRIGERRQREAVGLPLPDASRGTAPATAVAPIESAPAASPSEVVEVPPRLLRAPRPAYPRLARERRRQGTIELRVTVSTEGSVIAVERLGPPAGLGLDEAARAAALEARYEPGTRDGVPVEMTTTLAIRFQLEGPPPR